MSPLAPRLDLVSADIAALRAEHDRPDDCGLAIVGSFARGEASQYSDLDLAWFREPAAPQGHKFLSRGSRLVSLLFTNVTTVEGQLTRPEDAIWAAGGLRDMHIISDPGGALAGLRQRAASLDWRPLQAAADAYASRELAEFAEEAAKLLNALARSDPYMAINAATALWRGLAKAVAVHLGVIMTTENSWLSAVEAAAGIGDPWTHWLRLAAGLEEHPGRLPPPLRRAEAGIELYRETARRLDRLLRQEDRSIVQTVVGWIDKWFTGQCR